MVGVKLTIPVWLGDRPDRCEAHTQWDDIASPLAWKALSVGG